MSLLPAAVGISSIFISPSVGVGIQNNNLANNISKIENVFWISNNSEQKILRQITDDEEWLSLTDQNSQGDPAVFRVLLPASDGNNKIQTWPGCSSGWQNYSGGKIYYTYWAELAQLSADSDIPALPYELDTILVNGGVYLTALTQGDTVLLAEYERKYEDDKGEMRAWLINQRAKDGQQRPDVPMGVFGSERSVSGYKSQ